MKKLLFVFLVGCLPQMQTPTTLLGTGTTCRYVNDGRATCIDSWDMIWDCSYAGGDGWSCKFLGR